MAKSDSGQTLNDVNILCYNIEVMKLSLKQTLLILLLILTPLFLSLLPFFIQSYMSPIDRVFMGLHRWSEDYYGYLQSINQGLMGHITNVSKLTLQPHQPTFVHSEYVILGFVGRFLGLNSPLVYHLSRLFLGAVFVFSAFYFFYYLFKTVKRVTDVELGKFSRSRYVHETERTLTPEKIFYQGNGWQDPLFYSLTAFFLAFFVGGFPHITSWQPLHLEPYLSWWTELDVLTRSTILPHYLMGNIFFLLIIILFLKFSGQKRIALKSYFLLLISCFLLAFVHPIDFLILGCSLGVFVVLNIAITYFQCHSRESGNLYKQVCSLRKNIDLRVKPEDDKLNKSSTKNYIFLLLLVFVSGLLPALYYRFALSLPFWRFILAHGTTTAYNIPLLDLSLALGPVFFLGIAGLFVYLKNGFAGRPDNFLSFAFASEQKPNNSKEINSREYSGTKKIDGRPLQNLNAIALLLFSWLFVQTLFFLKFYQVFNFDRLRTMEAPFYLPLAFFAVVFIFQLKEWLINFLRSRYVHETERTLTPEKNFVRHSLIIVFVVLIFLITLPTTIIGLKNQIYQVSDFKTFSLFSYPTIKQYQSWQFLRDHTPDNSPITTFYEAKFLLPTVSGNKIAFGANFDNDKNYQNNVNKINQIYAGLLSPEDAQNFLHTYHIQYVYWGYQEQSLAGDLTKYPFLQKIFSNGEVIIFKVK